MTPVEKAKSNLKDALENLIDTYVVWNGEGRSSAYEIVWRCINQLIEAVKKECE